MVARARRSPGKNTARRAPSAASDAPTPSERAASIRDHVRHGEVRDLGPLFVALSDPVPGYARRPRSRSGS